MTLNLMLISRSAVYLSGDFRLTYGLERWKDNLDTQKLIPIFAYRWSALVSFAGVAQTSTGLDVGDWVSQQLAGIEMNARFDELPGRLLTADSWLSKVRGSHPLIFSIVGFIGRRPVAMVISNAPHINGPLSGPLLPRLRKFESRPKEPEVRVAGDNTAVRNQDIGELRKMLRENRIPREIEAAMAEANRSANERSSTISRECVTGHLLPTGKVEVTPHGIDEKAEYMPGFVQRHFAKMGVSGLNLKSDEKGNPLPPQWQGMTATQVQGPRRKDEGVIFAHVFENVVELVGTPREGSHIYTKIAGENEPERVTFQIDWSGKTKDEGATVPVEQIEAGKHETHAFEPAFHFEVGEGWGFYFPETADGLYMGIGPEGSGLMFFNPVKVFDPVTPSEQKEVPAPRSAHEWASWFQKHPELETSKPVPVSVGGASGVWLDVTAASTPENFPQYCGGRPCVPLFPTSGTPIVSFTAHAGVKTRFIIVDVSGLPVVVDVSAPADAFDEFLLKAEKVLDTVKWKGR